MKQIAMSKTNTTGKRVLKGDVWHDENGEIPGTPREWDPPMTADERHAAALSDPDNPPMTAEQLGKMRRISPAKFIRRKLGMSQEKFAERYHIPIGTLRDWEQGRKEPDAAAKAYLRVIERELEATAKALA
jgi:putative transcriptional regulator